MFFKRAALFASTLALLPAGAWAQATPEKAASLQAQVQDWLHSSLGPDIKIARDPVQITAAGDHYDVKIPFGNAPDAPRMTATMQDAGSGRWAVNDVRLSSPAVFRVRLPRAQGGVVTSTVAVGQQDGQMLIDPAYASPWTSASSMRDVKLETTGAGLQQSGHVGSARSNSTLTPSADGRLDLATDTTLHDYTMTSGAPAGGTPGSMSVGTAHLVGTIAGLSRERALEITHLIARGTPANHANSLTLLQAVSDLSTGLTLDQTIDQLTVDVGGLSFALRRLELGLGSRSETGQFGAQLSITADGLTLPDLGLGPAARLIPSKLSLQPSVAGLPTDALLQIAAKAANNEDPAAADIAALFSRGPVTAGLDNLSLEIAGSSFVGSGKLLFTSPQTFVGSGQIVGENLDRLQQSMAAAPQTASFVPILIFLKGIGRTEGNHLVWDLAYRDGHALVNNQDLSALAGAGASRQARPPEAPPAAPPRATPTPGRPVLRPLSTRP